MSDGPRPDLVAYTFVLLRRGPGASEYDDDELDRLQAGHLAFLDEMRRAGHLVMAGPFLEQEDESLRGFCLYRTGLDETRALVAGDPAVRAGRMAVDVMTWLTLRSDLDPGRDG
jgi:uncharacterized protein YciI